MTDAALVILTGVFHFPPESEPRARGGKEVATVALENGEVVRRTGRLSRYARRIADRISLPLPVFQEEINVSATPYELLNRIDHSRFLPLRNQRRHPTDWPTAWHGLTRWTLRPKAGEEIEDLDQLAFHVITQCCQFSTIAISRSIKPDKIKYRFVIAAGAHGHAGVIVFTGKTVKAVSRARAARG